MRTRLTAVAVLMLVGALALPARATHEAIQTLPVSGQASEVYVGLADDDIATAVWDDDGAVKAATRPADGFFGNPQTLASGSVSDIRFDESPNGNAVVAYIGGMSEGELIVHVRQGSGQFGPAQVLVADGAASIFGFDVAISNAGHAAVVWQESAAPNLIRAALSDASGQLGDATTVHQGQDLQGPKVDMDDLGNAVAVWEGVQTIHSAAAPVGGPFGPPSTLANLQQGQGLPDVAVSSGGDAAVVWKNFTFPDPQCDTPRDCTPVPVLEAVYGNATGSFGFTQSVTDPAQDSISFGEHEIAVDDSGTAAILFTATMSNVAGVFGAISDAFGSFSAGPVTVSAAAAAGANNFEIAAGGGEFTAVWANDHDQDGTGDAWQATSFGGSFGSPHQLSSEDVTGASAVHGGRVESGQSIGGWVANDGGPVPQVTPVAPGEPPVFGSDSADDLTGTDGPDVVHLLGGNDTYSGGAGADSIYGEEGNDILKGEGGDDLVDGGPGADTASGGGGNDTVLGGKGGDKLKGGSGDDELKGGDGNDVLDGGGIQALRASGAAVAAGAGETIFGGPGKDTCFKYSKQDVLKSCEIVKKKRAH